MTPHPARSRGVRRALRALRRRTGSAGLSPQQRWEPYLREVEPALAARPRVHRFAQVPQIGDPTVPAQPPALWVQSADETTTAATMASLQTSTMAPLEVLEGPLSQALADSRSERVLLVRGGDALATLALERFVQAAALAPDAHVITCDEDALDAGGRRLEPRFRPGPSPDRWLADDTSSLTLLVSREAAAAVAGGLSGGPAWRHELVLALAGPGGERAAHVPLLLSHRGPGLADPPPLSAESVQRRLASWDANARVQVDGGVRRVRRFHGGEPEVEVVICLRDRAELLGRCVDSLLAVTAYERLRVALVDNGSAEPETHELLARYDGDPRVRVLHDPRPFNFAALNNLAARGSAADVLVFLNNDTEVVDSEWASTLLEEALRPEVGAVAPMLLYPDGRVQHAGAALALHGYAGHPFAGLEPSRETPFGRAAGGTRNWMAVTAACLMVERAKFGAVGGFDEGFVVAGNDVDLCLRLTAAGHRSLCVPHAVVIHDESRSRGTHIDAADFVRSERSYGEYRTVGDPFYNPNLTLDATDCGVRVPPRSR